VQDLLATKVDVNLGYSMTFVVDLIVIDFVLVDSLVDAVVQLTYQVMMNFRRKKKHQFLIGNNDA